VKLAVTVHLHNSNKQHLTLANIYVNNASIIGNQSGKFQLSLPKQTSFRSLWITSATRTWNWSVSR